MGEDVESISTSSTVRCEVYLHPWKSAHQRFFYCLFLLNR